ncbi:monooxygenase [Alteribacillus iranensis]|uniref:Putative mono-oxygenase ydhR n=1 Tax=Alteribacillus iranensis TaxID=930128 RepID=A0A1I2FJ18_9BACI|nr:monooxygenase [Alteribacillus iranensis]SFF05432.1 Putative mono-oxygenase ydhR [Alteribacillus iranensis]
MAYVLQVNFKMDGPFGEDMAASFAELAESINQEEGFLWKIWIEDPDTKETGGIYLFETKEAAQAYQEMHTKRLASFGIEEIDAKIFSINSTLTEINKGPVTSFTQNDKE